MDSIPAPEIWGMLPTMPEKQQYICSWQTIKQYKRKVGDQN